MTSTLPTVLTNFEAATDALVYGPSRGNVPLRKGMAQWLGSMYHNDPQAVEEARICIAGGASQNLGSAMLRFTDPSYTRYVWMVEPTYFLACPIFEDCGFAGKLRGVPEDNEGIDLEFLQKALSEAESEAAKNEDMRAPKLKTPALGYQKIYKHVIYVVPTFSNPSGKIMSLQHRYDLVQLAIKYDALIISDDVYDFLSWPQERRQAFDSAKLKLPPRLVDINRELDPDSKWGNTMSNGSFSKIVAPGVRVSWSESTSAFATFLSTTGSSVSGGNPGHMASAFVEKMISSGALQKHIQEQLIPCYASRYYAMIDAVKEYLEPLGVEITTGKPYSIGANGREDDLKVAGGFFLLITLPKGLPPTPELAKHAIEDFDLKFAYGRMFEVKGDKTSRERSDAGFGSTIRLCWAFHEEEAIVEGILRMRDLIEKYRDIAI